jgi:hypothetical protein
VPALLAEGRPVAPGHGLGIDEEGADVDVVADVVALRKQEAPAADEHHALGDRLDTLEAGRPLLRGRPDAQPHGLGRRRRRRLAATAFAQPTGELELALGAGLLGGEVVVEAGAQQLPDAAVAATAGGLHERPDRRREVGGADEAIAGPHQASGQLGGHLAATRPQQPGHAEGEHGGVGAGGVGLELLGVTARAQREGAVHAQAAVAADDHPTRPGLQADARWRPRHMARLGDDGREDVGHAEGEAERHGLPTGVGVIDEGGEGDAGDEGPRRPLPAIPEAAVDEVGHAGEVHLLVPGEGVGLADGRGVAPGPAAAHDGEGLQLAVEVQGAKRAGAVGIVVDDVEKHEAAEDFGLIHRRSPTGCRSASCGRYQMAAPTVR